MAEQREIERTYAPGPDDALPDLSTLPGVAQVSDAQVDELDAVYFDTADLALTRAGVSLRRRTGGKDEGWHLKIPAEDGRDEIHTPLGRSLHKPPAQLRNVVPAWTRGAALKPVATIATRRTRRNLLDEDGAVLAEVADDEVTGTPDGAAAPVTWREWEFELVDGDRALGDAADALMVEAGVEPSVVQRKILRVLGDRVGADVDLPPVKRGKPGGRVLQRRLAEQVAELHRRDSQIRRRHDEGVHRARVACRRLRAALATYRPLVDREVTDPIRDEIKWLGRCLSDARDTTVVDDRLRKMIDAEPPRMVVGPVRRRLATTYRERRRVAWAAVDEALDSDRYFALLASLDRLVADPPWTDKADEAAVDVLPQRVRKDWRRLRDRVAGVEGADDPEAELHEVRKDAKRLRYASEALRPLWGKDAKRLAKAAKKLTSHLGERQDTVMSRPYLLETAAAAHDAGEPSVTWGLLIGRDEERAAELDRELPAVWDKVSRKRLRRWLR